jgi:hypothetical protein
VVWGQAQNDLKSHDPIFASCLFPKQGVYFSRWGPPDRYLKPQFSLHCAMSDYKPGSVGGDSLGARIGARAGLLKFGPLALVNIH